VLRRKSGCEEKIFMCDIWNVYFSESVIDPVLKSVAEKLLVEIVTD
jgi:hypothetical protein